MSKLGFGKKLPGTLDRQKAADYDRLCAKIWVTVATLAAKQPTPTALETELRKRYPHLGPDNSGNLARYAAGAALPFRRNRRGAPLTRPTDWADRARHEWPITHPWLITPFWYLAGATPDVGQLLHCIRLLPEDFQDYLLKDGALASEDIPELASVPRNFVYALTAPLGPYALGALYCGLRIARLVDDLHAERWCWVGISWALTEMERVLPNQLSNLLAELNYLHLLDANDRMYLPGMPSPLAQKDVELFQRERDAYLKWSVEEQIAAGENPTWVE